jgi:DNA repair protein RadA/Sms
LAKSNRQYVCTECGTTSWKWFGRCAACGAFNTAEEEAAPPSGSKSRKDLGVPVEYAPPVPIDQVPDEVAERLKSGMLEFDRVLGGGIVPGSMVLLGGDPGIGKSTLMLQVADAFARRGLRVLYVSGEESPQQLRLRASRLDALSPNILVMTRTALEDVLAEPGLRQADLVIVDSLQSLASLGLDAAAGTVSQVREVAVRFTHFAKTTRIPVVIVGHVTKEGVIAGPKLVEHVVDSVLSFEGDSHHAYRLLRSLKNRFGPAQELGVFEMVNRGLREVANPSEVFLSQRERDMAGAVVVPTMEGSRPLLAEVQALVSAAPYGNARRVADGVDVRRVLLVVAVLEKQLGVVLQNEDIFVNIAGGLRVQEPGVDLAVAAAVLSSHYETPFSRNTVFLGEISLTGEIRAVQHLEPRLREASRLGFGQAVTAIRPRHGAEEMPPKLQLTSVATVRDLAKLLRG